MWGDASFTVHLALGVRPCEGHQTSAGHTCLTCTSKGGEVDESSANCTFQNSTIPWQSHKCHCPEKGRPHGWGLRPQPSFYPATLLLAEKSLSWAGSKAKIGTQIVWLWHQAFHHSSVRWRHNTKWKQTPTVVNVSQIIQQVLKNKPVGWMHEVQNEWFWVKIRKAL